MRINENFYNGYKTYPCELKEQVEEVFKYTSHITNLKRLLTDIRQEADNLRMLFLIGEELEKRRKTLDDFNSRVQETMHSTLRNLEGYRQYRWQELFCEGENSDGGINTVQENRR